MTNKITKVNKEIIDHLACIAVGVTYETVLQVWKCARRYSSWDLDLFMASPPAARSTIYKVRRVLFLSKITGGLK
jgi:hypothetical protein